MLNRYIKRDDGRSAWARLRGKECDSPLAQIGETVDFKIVRGEVAKLEPRWAVGTFLGRTDESDEVIVGTAAGIEFARSFRRRAANKQWERDAFTTFIGLPRNPRGLAVEAPVAKQQAAVHHEGAHPPAWRITRVCSVPGNCFAVHSEVQGQVRAADQPERHG